MHDSTHNVTFTVSPAIPSGNFRLQVYDSAGVGVSQWISSLIPADTEQTNYTSSWTLTQMARVTWHIRLYYFDVGGVANLRVISDADFTISP